MSGKAVERSRSFFAGICLLLFAGTSYAQYRPVDKGSSIVFSVKNFGIRISGRFNGLQGAIRFSKDNPAATQVEVSVDANSISTGNELRDKHLRDEDFFDVAKYPSLQFVSTAVTSGKGQHVMTGNITIKGITKPVSFPFTVIATPTGYTFACDFIINRKDFHVGESRVISDEVQINLQLATEKL